MDFYAVLDQVLDLLRQRGRVAYRVLKLQFKLDDETQGDRILSCSGEHRQQVVFIETT